jgi:hypothetical protein
MGILHDEMMKIISEPWTDGSKLRELVQLILLKHGMSLSESQLDLLVRGIEAGEASVEVPSDGPPMTVSFSPEMIERAMHELEEKCDMGVQDAVMRSVEDLAPRILKSLYDALPGALREWHRSQRAFERRLRRRWKAGLDRLDMLITMAHEAGETYIADLRRELEGEKSSEEILLLDVLAGLHCRACRTAREVVCLMKAGYADGADARWRSLHELAVTASFLLQHKGDTAERYLEHGAVDRWNAAQKYQQHCHMLGYEPYSAAEMKEMEDASDAAILKYGNSFGGDYGWAAKALKGKRPSFTAIEADIDMSHWRPHYKLACQSVHAGSRSLFFSLGLPRYSPKMLLAGASDAGLADPGHKTAISLMMVTVAFLTCRPNLDGLVTCNCLLTLCDDIGQELSQVNEATQETGDKLASEEEPPVDKPGQEPK